jgi:hypothetical protein
MEPEGSLPHSQEPVTFPCPEPSQSCPCALSHFLKIHFNRLLSSHLRLGLPSGFFPSGFPHQNPVCTSPLPLAFLLIYTSKTPTKIHSFLENTPNVFNKTPTCFNPAGPLSNRPTKYSKSIKDSTPYATKKLSIANANVIKNSSNEFKLETLNFLKV